MIYNDTRYVDAPADWLPIYVATRNDYPGLSNELVSKVVEDSIKGVDADRIVLDIEGLLVDKKIEFTDGLFIYREALRAAKKYRPNADIGQFGMMPVINHKRSIKSRTHAKYKFWRDQCKLMGLATHYADTIYPSCYRRWLDRRKQARFVRETLKQAGKYGKPIIPFISPVYIKPDENPNMNNTYMDRKEWSWYVSLFDRYDVVLYDSKDHINVPEMLI